MKSIDTTTRLVDAINIFRIAMVKGLVPLPASAEASIAETLTRADTDLVNMFTVGDLRRHMLTGEPGYLSNSLIMGYLSLTAGRFADILLADSFFAY